MYDYDKLKEKAFVIKTGFKGSYKMLDGEDYDILPEDVIVSTDGSIGCVAGVMGSDATKIDENSKNIVIEAATFDGPQLRQTARRLNLLTDASQHFIKGAIDTANSLNVLDRCADLLVQLADAKEIYETVHSDLNVEEKKVSVTVERVNGLLGTSFTTDEVKDVFDRLQFKYDLEGTNFTVTVPTYRNDISMDADLIEEVARLYGYDNIPSTLPEMSMTKGELTPKQQKERAIVHILSDLGLHETLTYTLTSPSSNNDFNLFHPKDEEIKLMSPLGEEHSVARKSILPHMLDVIKYNNDHSIKDVNIFEIANTYVNEEIEQLGIAMSGNYIDTPWLGNVVKADYYIMKGIFEKVMHVLNIDPARYSLIRVEEDNKDFHPGRSAYVKMGKEIVGVVGQVHPAKAKAYGIDETYVCELNLTSLIAVRSSKIKFTPLPQYPSVSRDIALIVDRKVPASDIERTIFKASKLIKGTKIFDVYEGEHVADDQKSIAVSLTLQDDKRTLDEKSVNEAMEKVLEAVKKAYNAELRS
jgi:phenylalanyl-tRNA synthetase beta chain